MLKYADEQMDCRRWDGCPVVDIFDIKIVRKISPNMYMHLIHLRHCLNKRSRAFPVCN